MRRAARVDGNHAAIRDAFRDATGTSVLDVHDYPPIGCDLLVYVGGECIHVEIKDGSKPPSARHLTPNELAAQARCIATGNRYHVVTCLDDVARVLQPSQKGTP